MAVRAKFIVSTITRSRQSVYDYATKQSQIKEVQTVKLFPTANSATPEDEQFWASTPQGSIELGIVNPAAVEQFANELGKAVYVDFTPADD